LKIEIVSPDQSVDEVSALHLEICIVLFCPIDTPLGSFETLLLSADELSCMLDFDRSAHDSICSDTLR